MTDTRTVTLPDGHQDIETLINGVWAITHCSLGDEPEPTGRTKPLYQPQETRPQPEAST